MQKSYASERSAYPNAMVVNIHHKPTWKDDNVLVPKAGLRVPVVNIPQRPEDVYVGTHSSILATDDKQVIVLYY